MIKTRHLIYPHKWSNSSTTKFDWTLHQLSPYIGRMKTSMAQSLIKNFTRQQDVIFDPFCGSGVVPLEAAALGRNVIANDWNPYAFVLTKAKLFPPSSLRQALSNFERTWNLSRALLKEQDLRTVPKWVRAFFHPKTLKSALAFRDACLIMGDYFLLACLLGILHHQRPGFLSYPSSHLVPYLRDRKFPESEYPELYEERPVHPRLLAKITRTYNRFPDLRFVKKRVTLRDARNLTPLKNINAVVTSPPYMNELDYVRDNRLRLWFVKKEIPENLDLPKANVKNAFTLLLTTVCCRIAPMIKKKGVFILVLGDTTRVRHATDTADIAKILFDKEVVLRNFELLYEYKDLIPDIRRSRREYQGTKVETILVFRRNRT